MKKNILFVTYGGGHAHMVYPVVHALRGNPEYKSGQINIEVLGLPAARATLNAHGVECFGFGDYLMEEDSDALAWGQALAKDHHSPTIGVPLEESVAYLGLCYKDLVTRFGKTEAEASFKKKARQSFYPLTVMERIFDDIKPDFVVTSNSPRSEAAAIETANKRGIDNLIMTDLFTGLGDYPLRAKHITFINEYAKDMFARDGLVDEKHSAFYYTGNPAFDRILKLPGEKDPTWVSRHFPQATGRPLVLHADMPAYWHAPNKASHFKSESEIIEEMEACYSAAMENGAAYLIRPHPSQDRRLYLGWLEGREHAYFAAECDLHELLRHIDLLIVRTTTVGLEAAYLQQRILQLDCNFHVDLPLVNMGIAWGVNDYKELSREVKNALSDDKKLEKIRSQVKQMLPAEPAAAKIASIILEKVSNRH